jgi:hypothetical protein
MISRKRIVELAHEATADPYQIDDDWIVRFMTRLAQEDPTLAAAVKKAANKKAKELNVKTI